jgi:hypothetical protein
MTAVQGNSAHQAHCEGSVGVSFLLLIFLPSFCPMAGWECGDAQLNFDGTQGSLPHFSLLLDSTLEQVSQHFWMTAQVSVLFKIPWVITLCNQG